MPNIELYVGTRKKQNRYEKYVLSRVLGLLTKHAKDAVIFYDIWLDGHQVDILVGTETTTLQLEVKGWRWPVRAQQNGDWEVTDENGTVSPRKNAYLQALTNNQKLRNEMARYLRDGVGVDFPNGAVIFEPEIHPDSKFNMRPDPRVVMRGSDQLEDLLNAPSPVPWKLSWMRGFAQELKLIPMPLPGATDQLSRWSVERQRPSAIALIDIDHDARRPVADVIGNTSPSARAQQYLPQRVPPAYPTIAAGRRGAAYAPVISAPVITVPSSLRGSTRRPSGVVRWLLRYSPILCMLLVAAYMFKAPLPFSHKDSLSKLGVRERSAVRHFAAKHVAAHQRSRMIEAKGTPVHPAEASIDTTLPSSPSSTYVPSIPPAPITCPAGVDRLGCNGRIGTFSAPDCPPGFSVSGGTCIRASGG